ncbi:type IV toxin-antitoxin system AbiEi family antitoxin [Citricoccus nitrophenolicus]|uniref:type IV toxin-antitoxin system AbiEi family antitoxin n=1 Tax=Citricoccus nitrophenolicus TaxID=863575 RepID=UPI0039B5291E
MDEQLAQELADRFDEFGLRFLEPIDLNELPTEDTVSATLAHQEGHAPYQVGCSDTLTLSSMGWVRRHYAEHDRLLLVGPRVTERSAERLRLLGINYIDQAGNAFITFNGVHIDVRGRRALRPSATKAPRLTRGGVNLFSVKRSQVIFTILSWPDLLDGPVREIATASMVSLGQAQGTLDLLMQYGYLDEEKHFAPSRRELLIDHWTASYPSGLGSEGKAGRYSGDWASLRVGDASVYVSGEAAVPELLRPETATLYTEEFPIELIRSHRWRRNDEQPTIFLRRQFWRPSDAPAGPGVHEAPWLLVYADLLASNDGRQHEVAQRIREDHR